jgi:ubiquinone/menaquinone biosynthesis C-methylase UbiE
MLKGDSYIAANYYQNGSFLDGYIRNFEIYNRSLSNVTAEEDILIFWPLEGKSWEECIYKGSKISCSLIGNVSKELVAPALEREAASALGNVLSLETSFHIKLNAPVSGRFQVLLKAGPNGNFKVNNISLIPELSFKSFSWYKGVISLQEGLNDLLLEVDEGSSLDLLVISLKGNFSNIAKKSAQYSFKLVSYTNYELTVNNSGPVYVVLGQTFHPGWQLIHGNGKVNSFNVNLWANGFVFEGQGFRKATIYFGPQHLHVTGIAIWAITCLFLMGVILYSYLRRLRLRLDSVRALKKRIRDYWNRWPCVAPQELKKHTEDKKPIYRYKMQPFIPAFAKFSNYKGKRVLEIGLGAGTDFIQFKNSNVESIGIDISMVSLKICKRRLKLYGLDADIICADGENMPFRNGVFDMVYSYGVIHHCPFPEKVVDEIYRTLKNGGELKVMIYHRPSLAALRKYLVAILKGRWRRSVNAVISEVLESKGTRTYTIGEARNLFKKFKNLKMQPTLVFYDLMIFGHPPPWFLQKILNRLGWFLHIYAIK